MRGTTDKADVFRVMGTCKLRRLANDVGSSGTSLPHTECLDHIMPRPQAFFTKAYVPLECKLHEAEMEMLKKELLVSSPLPHGQAISFKMKLRVGGSIILDKIRNFESCRNLHLREYAKPSNSAYEIVVLQTGNGFLPSVEGSPPLTLSSFLLTPDPPSIHKDNVLEEFRVCYPKVRPMLIVMLLDSLSLIRGVAVDVSSLNCCVAGG
ncbi:uncharacterized protein G2W53_039602 [Senna tora]|uniref:Uncharacterized protein n=1 Tax=Senna tora TaxID=362788 RepID=A0A834W6A6_9FABA|nr:uncharacterized protein G2W53_039602 [Senna tora]